MVFVSCFGVKALVMVHFMFVYYTLVQFGLLSGHLLGSMTALITLDMPNMLQNLIP